MCRGSFPVLLIYSHRIVDYFCGRAFFKVAEDSSVQLSEVLIGKKYRIVFTKAKTTSDSGLEYTTKAKHSSNHNTQRSNLPPRTENYKITWEIKLCIAIW